MTPDQRRCPKCDGTMSVGFVPDIGYGAAFVGSWHLGRPKKRFIGQTRIERSAMVPIGAYRCDRCGFVELYADGDHASR